MSKPKRYIMDYERDAWRPLDNPPTPGFVVTAVLAAMAFALVLLLGDLYLISQRSVPNPGADVAVVEMPYCQQEDGSDVEGYCMWIDPDTGKGYINPVSAGFEADTGAYIGGFN